MRRLQVSAFSETLDVRLLTRADVPEILRVYASNPLYFRLCGTEASEQNVLRDLTLLPPGKPAQDKYFAGFFDAGALCAVLDLIDGFPDAQTAYVGLFMVAGERSGQGLGGAIIEALLRYLRAAGFASVRLGYDPENPPASHFWRKLGFRTLREVEYTHPGGRTGRMAVAERAP